MKNVAPSRALVRRSRQLLQLALVVGAVGIFIAAVSFGLTVVPLTSPSSASYSAYIFVIDVIFAFGGVIFLAALAMVVRAITWKTDNDLAMITGKFLAQYLDDNYIFIRNVSKRALGYIDAVLVGPPGALVFRIMDNEGIFANEAANWLKQNDKGEWMPAGISPTRQAVDDIKSLREFLAQRNLADVPVFGVVVFTKADPKVKLMAKEPVVPLTMLDSLVTNLGANYLAKERMDAQKAAAVVRLLYDQ